MTAGKEKNPPKNNYGLLRDRTIIVLLITSVIICGSVCYSLYYTGFIKASKCNYESEHPYYCNYGYYSVDNLVKGTGYLDLIYYTDNESWVLPDKINDVVHFSLTHPETGGCVDGYYTPDISVINNTLYIDILVINWKDAIQEGSYYQISDFASACLYYDDSGYDWDSYYRSLEMLSVNKYDKKLEIDGYDETRIAVPAFGTLAIPDEIRDLPENTDYQYILFEKSHTGSFYDKGYLWGMTSIACNVKIV